MTEWFKVSSVHDIEDADAVRWKLAYNAAYELVNPPPKRK